MTASVYDIIDERRHFAEQFVLVPDRLNNFRSEVSLQWSSVPFVASSAKDVSTKPGIYAFILKSENSDLPPHGYIMYIGITKTRKRAVYLRQRFREYLRDQEMEDNPKRSHISDMLRRWSGCMQFYFATIEEDIDLLQSVETTINDAVQPPRTRGDLSAKVRAAKRAF